MVTKASQFSRKNTLVLLNRTPLSFSITAIAKITSSVSDEYTQLWYNFAMLWLASSEVFRCFFTGICGNNMINCLVASQAALTCIDKSGLYQMTATQGARSEFTLLGMLCDLNTAFQWVFAHPLLHIYTGLLKAISTLLLMVRLCTFARFCSYIKARGTKYVKTGPYRKTFVLGPK